MNLFDFICAAFRVVGTFISVCWGWLIAGCIVLIVVGLLLSEKRAPLEEWAQTLNEKANDEHAAYANHGTRMMPPLYEDEMVALAQEWLKMQDSTTRHTQDESNA